MNIDRLIQFEPKTKAIAEEVNSNFEQLRLSNNEHEVALESLYRDFEDYKLNTVETINCELGSLELNSNTNNYKVSGTSTIYSIIGILSGIVFIEFLDVRQIINSENLQLQNNTDRITKSGDVGIYSCDNGIVKEINYFTAKEEKTNAYPTQTILDAPKNELGKTDFIDKIKFTKDIMPIMDTYENEEVAVSSSSQYDAVSYMPWKAFRHHTADVGGWITVNGVNTGWLKIHFKQRSPKIMAFSINSRNSSDAYTHSPSDFIIEGSNNDVDWTLLGDYTNNLNWAQNEKRYFALTYFDNFKYYRITITKNSGGAAFSGFGAMELFEAENDYLPMVGKINLSMENPLLINTGIGTSTIGKLNQLSIINNSVMIENLLNNALMYVGFKKNANNRFEHFTTSACPVYANLFQRYSNKNSIPKMLSYTTSREYNYGYTVSCSSVYTPVGATYPGYLAFNGDLNNKWVASVAGGNQWIQIDYPNYRKIARFSIVASNDDPGSAIKNGCLKGFNGEEWVVLKEIINEPAWNVIEKRYYDVDVIDSCCKFKLEIYEVTNPTSLAQISNFEIFELADCFVIPDNKFYSYNSDTEEFEEAEIIYVGRIKTQNNFISDALSYATENKYISEKTNININTLYSFFHNLGFDYPNLKVSGWIKENITGYTMPWCVDSNYDYGIESNNYGFHIDECQFNIRTPTNLMRFKDCENIYRTYTGNVSFVLQVERIF